MVVVLMKTAQIFGSPEEKSYSCEHDVKRIQSNVLDRYAKYIDLVDPRLVLATVIRHDKNLIYNQDKTEMKCSIRTCKLLTF